MSLSFYLCRTPPDVGPMVTWEDNHAQPLGGIDDIKARISALFPDIEWAPVPVGAEIHWSGLGKNEPGRRYLDLSVSTAVLEEDGPAGQVYFVVGRKTPPSILRKLMEELNLNHVSCPDTGELVDPYAYSDEDVYFYAIKGAPPSAT